MTWHSRLWTQNQASDFLFVLSQPVARELLDIGRRYAAMEAEVARLSQQSAELQGKPPLFPLLKFICCTFSLLNIVCRIPSAGSAREGRRRAAVLRAEGEARLR